MGNKRKTEMLNSSAETLSYVLWQSAQISDALKLSAMYLFFFAIQWKRQAESIEEVMIYTALLYLD